VNGVVGGTAANGTISASPNDPTSATYSAPQTAPSGGSVTIHVRSNTDSTVSASATVTFSAPVQVSLTPATATLAVGHRQTFSVQVAGTPNQLVSLLVNGGAGGTLSAGQTCATGSNPCQQISATGAGSFDYLAPSGVPSPNPVTVTAESEADTSKTASAAVTILPHIIVSVLPASVTLPGGGQQSFTASVLGTSNQLVVWTISGAGCAAAGACGSIDSTGLYTAPSLAPSPNLVTVTATSSEDPAQAGTATATISSRPNISSLAPSSAYAGSAGGFTLKVSGSNFLPSAPGPGSTIWVAGTPRVTSCASSSQCTTSFGSADLLNAGNLDTQVQNPDQTLSNTVSFVVLAPGTGPETIPLTPSAPSVTGMDIVVVELSTNGGSGASGNVSLNVAAIGQFVPATSTCILGGNPVVIVRPATGTGTADLCAFSVSGLDPSFTYTLTGPAVPDIVITNREPLGLGIVHLTLQVPSTAVPGPRTLFVENPDLDMTAATGAIEVR
jgi:hypothetical protein